MNNNPASTHTNTSASSYKDQRIHPRTILSSTVSVFDKNTSEYIGLLVDVSDEGVMLSSYLPLTEHSQIEVDIVEIPKGDGSRRTGTIKLEVVWSHSISSSMHGNGCRIIDMNAATRSMMQSFQADQ